MKGFLVFGLALVFLGASSQALAQRMSVDPLYLGIDPSQTVVKKRLLQKSLSTSRFGTMNLTKSFSSPKDVADGGERVADKETASSGFASMGKEIWEVIQANKPVVDVSSDFVSVLPKESTHWSDMQGWSAPDIYEYEIQLKNFYRVTVVYIRYVVSFSHSGTPVNGAGGKYLANVTVSPEKVDVLWGYNVSASTKVKDITNAGNAQNPIAAVQMVFSWKVSTLLRDIQGSRSFYVTGNGDFEDLTERSPLRNLAVR